MSEQAQIGENILNASNGLKIEKLSKAVEDHVQVKLINYSSLNSNTDATRLFEPITFTTNYTGVIGVDVQKAPDEARIFNINRIGQVELLQKHQKFASEIEIQPIDAFGFKGENLFDVRLKYNINETFTLGFLCENILNKTYLVRPAYMGSPRTFMFQLKKEF